MRLSQRLKRTDTLILLQKRHKGVIRQNNKWRQRWDVLIIIFAVYNCVELPLEVAYNYRASVDQMNISNYLNHVIDFLFLLDIILNFFTTFTHKDTGEEITQKNLIATNYLRNNFLVDLVSTIPFENIYIMFLNQEELAQEGNSTVL